MHTAVEREAMVRDRDHAAERVELKGEIASLEKNVRLVGRQLHSTASRN